MTASRNISKTGPISGQDHVTVIADTVNQLSKYMAGNAIAPYDTNAVKFTIDVMTGLTGIPDGFELDIIMPNTNTSAMTFEIIGSGLGTKPVRNNAGVAFTGGEFTAGTAYKFKFWGGAVDHWRLVGAASLSDAGVKFPFIFTAIGVTPGAWSFTASTDLDLVVSIVGGGGGGASSGSTRTGGGAGGHARKFLTLSAGDVISGVVGSGGAAGAAGTSSTVTSSDVVVSMTASGGAAGLSVIGTAAGGTATGGDANFTGGGSIGSGTGRYGGGAPGLNGAGTSATVTAGAESLPDTYPAFVKPFRAAHIYGGNGSGGGNGSPGANGGGGGGGDTGGAGGDGFIVIEYSGNKS